VQRLAESSRNATSQISSLVNNIQVETADTMMTMNKTITRVVAESELAERAGQQMQETQQTTESLVNAVKRIAEDSQQQARISIELKDRGQKIHHSTEETNRELEGQRLETEQLVHFSQRLTESVRIFKLPGDGDSKSEPVKLRKHG
jgi:methyl-accepting chemotaxis protein